jgi:hypothetical protein
MSDSANGHHRHFFRHILSPDDNNEISASTILMNTSENQCQNFFQRYTIIALLIASGIFFIFTVIMILEQIDTIRTGKGKIARMKQRVGASGSTEYETVTEEFNEMFGGTSPNVAWHWFVPIQVRYPKKMKQVVLGYEFNPATCNPCAPYGMENTTNSDVPNGCDESIPLSRSSSLNNNLNNNQSIDALSDVDIESNVPSDTGDGLLKVGSTITTTKTKSMKKPPVPPSMPSGDGIFHREVSNDNSSISSNSSTLNRRPNRNAMNISSTSLSDTDGLSEGISLVERSRTRIT